MSRKDRVDPITEEGRYLEIMESEVLMGAIDCNHDYRVH